MGTQNGRARLMAGAIARKARGTVTRSLLLAASIAALACAVAGCPSTATSVPYTPITGIEVRASDVTVGHGCGTGADQVYKYAAVVSYQDSGKPIAAGVFDCFADAIFSNLQPDDMGSLTFNVAVYAYNAATFPSALAPCTPQQMQPPNSCATEDAGAVLSLGEMANWTTTCTATQPIGATQVASCCPLVPRGVPACSDAGASVEEAGTADAPADAIADGPADAATDAPVSDAPADALVDAPADAPVDALADAPVDAPVDAPADAPVD